MKIGKKSAFCERRYNFKANEKSVSKFDTTTAVLINNPSMYLLNYPRKKNPSKSVKAGSGRGDPHPLLQKLI